MGGRGAASQSTKASASESVMERITREMTAENDKALADVPDLNASNIGEYVPSWKLDQEFSTREERYAWDVSFRENDYIKRQSDKSVLIARPTDWGTLTIWVPKSLLHGGIGKYELQSEINYKVGGLYNEYLRNTAKQSGVKIGSVRKTQKIMDKLNASGVEFMDKQQFKAAPYEKLFG